MKRLPPKSGYLLPLAIVFLAVLLLLLLNLSYLGRTGDQIYLHEELRFQQSLLSFQTENSLGYQLANPTAASRDQASLNSDFTASYERAKLKVSWGERSSVHRAVKKQWASFENLFKSRDELALASYEEGEEAFGNQVAAADHTLVELKAERKLKHTISYSAGFPYGAYAPNGKVILEEAKSWSNPSIEATKDKSGYQRYTGLPVDILAQDEIEVTESFPLGYAYSSSGPIKLPRKSRAIGFTQARPDGNYADALQEEILDAFSAIRQDQIDKTHYFDDAVLSVAHLLDILQGKRDLRSVLGIGQAHKVPFFPIPSIQDDVFLFVFALHHPWPVDFSGRPHNKELTEELQKKHKELTEAQEELEKLQKELMSDLDSQTQKSKAEIEKIKRDIARAEQEIEDLEDEVKEIEKELQDAASDISGQTTYTEVPTNAEEEREVTTTGWSYVHILGSLAEIVGDLIAGKDPLSALFIPTRVVNLGDQDPKFDWPGGRIKITGSLTVPRGRTFTIDESLEVHGDVWIQRGATLYINGHDLRIQSPGEWKDFQGRSVEASDLAAFPKGRLLLEPGATLLVDGDLDIDGGTDELGSVLLVSHIGPTRAIDQAILVKGKVNIAHGIYPGMGVDDLIRAQAPKDKNLQGFVEDFYNPFFTEAVPFIAKFPYVGPWQWRKCWFAKYATTFEFVPEAVFYPGPYPIPLPFPNCLRKVFKYVSIAYSVELNFATGENLYTQSPFWPFGRGVSPVFTKTDPELVADAFKELKWDKIVLDSLIEEGGEFIKELLPELVKELITEVLTDIVKSIAKELIPFSPPSCGGGSKEEEEEGGPTEKIKEKLKEYLKEMLKESAKGLLKGFEKTIEDIRDEVYEHVEDESHPNTIVRELPGVLVYSGEDMSIGRKGSELASGLFYAEGDLDIDSERAVGCLISGQGLVEAKTLYHFPYYSRACLYNPRKPKDYKANVIDDFFRSALQVAVPDPEKNTSIDIGRTTYHVTASGWNR